MTGSEPAWTLDLTHGVALIDPTGVQVRFPYQKVEDLFVCLAIKGIEGIDRDEMAVSLWPRLSDESRSTNLRQTLTRLRKILGGEAIDSTRDVCKLSSVFLGNLHIQGVLSEPPQEELETLCMPIDGFARTIQWLAVNDPLQTLEMMRASVQFTLGMSRTVLQETIESIAPKLPHSDRLRGWLPFWQGHCALLGGRIQDVEALFSLSAQSGELQRDALLLTESYFWWGASQILLGRPHRALKLADKAEAILASWKSPERAYQINNLRATVLLHLKRNREAFEIFERINGYSNLNTMDLAGHEVLKAFYFATIGDFKSSRAALEFPRKLADESGIRSLDAICRLATGVIEAQEQPSRAFATLGPLIDASKPGKSAHFELYAHETLAIAYLRTNNPIESQRSVNRAQSIRRQLGIQYTGWDQTRLEPLLSPA